MSVTRFGVSLEKELLEALDEYVMENQFSNRSQAIRHLINKNLVEQKWQCNNVVAGTVTLIYDPTRKELQNQVSSVQVKYPTEIISSQKIVIDNLKMMEILALKGKAKRLTSLADQLITIKGIQHGKLTMSRAD